MTYSLKYYELEQEILDFKREWKKTKTCRCWSDECKHLEPLIAESFNHKLDALLHEAINHGCVMMGAEAPFPRVGKANNE